MSTVYNVCLVPIGDLADRLTAYSQDLATKNASLFVLGPSSVPHATVLQFSSNAEEAQVLKTFHQLSCEKQISVNLSGLVLLPTEDGELWCEVAILKSSALQALQLAVIENMRSIMSDIKNAVEDKFRPHFTVAFNSMSGADTLWRQPHLPTSLLRASSEVCELRIGRSGDNFQVNYLLD